MKSQAGSLASEDIIYQEDRDLVATCLEGDSKAWETLLSRYQRLIYSIPLKARLSTDDAADIFQSVCVKLYEKLSTLRDHEKLSSWIITTTTREVWRVSARQRRESQPAGLNEEGEGDITAELPATGPLADEEREMFERQQLVREAVESLPERCRELITMLFYQKDEWSYADIASRLNMPIASIGPTRARCLEKVKKLLQDKI